MLPINVLLIDLGGGASRFFPVTSIDIEKITPDIEAYKDNRTKNLHVISLAVDPVSVWRIENWEEIFNNLTNAVFLDMYQLLRITPIEVFGLGKADIVVLVVEGYEDCGKPLALVKKFDVKIVTALKNVKEAPNTPGATVKIPFSATLDYYNRRGQLYTKPVTKQVEYLRNSREQFVHGGLSRHHHNFYKETI